MLGQCLSDRYQITETLSSGGFGNTYLAQDKLRPGQPICVVKQLCPAHRDPARLEIARRQFNLEAIALEKIGVHPQIPQLLAYFECGKEFYLVEEYIQGKPLQQEIDEHDQAWPEEQVVQLLIDLLTVLDFIHSQNVIHRDIKPSNLIRRAVDQKLILIDFGAVKLVEAPLPTPTPHHRPDPTELSIVIGTPGYMPTEQMSGKPQRVSDIYALGIIAVELLTGQQVKQLRLDAHNEVTWPKYDDTNPLLHQILKKMTRMMPQNRYQSAAEVLDDLKALGIGSLSSSNTIQNQPTTVISTQASNNGNSHNTAQASLAGSSLPTTVVSPGNSPTMNTGGGMGSSNPVSSGGLSSSAQPQVTAIWKQVSLPHLKKIGAIALVLGLGTGAVAGGRHYFAVENQKKHLGEIHTDRDGGNLVGCVQKAKGFPGPNGTQPFKQAHEMEGTCQTTLGEQYKKEGKLKDAIAALRAVPADTESYARATTLMDDWSGDIMNLGQVSFDRGMASLDVNDLKSSFNYLNDIPTDTKSAAKVVETRDRWSEQLFEKAKSTFERAEKAANADAALLAIDVIPQEAKIHQRSQQERAVMHTKEREYRGLERQIGQHLGRGECAPAETLVKRLEGADYTGWQNIARKEAAEVQRCFTPIDLASRLTTNSNKYGDRFYSEQHSWKGFKDKEVQIVVDSDDFNPFLSIKDSEGEELYRGFPYGDLTFTPERDGTYYVSVVSPRSTGDYTLKVQREK